MDLKIAQRIVTELIGEDYIIYETTDSSKYVFADYKHSKYEIDDDRGKLIGVGPVVFNKESGEYKLLGSGEYVMGDYFKYINNKNTSWKEVLPFEEIKANIIRRQYVNLDDLDYLKKNNELVFGDIDSSIVFKKEFEYSKFLVYETKNINSMNFIKDFWKEIQFDFKMISEAEILLSRVK